MKRIKDFEDYAITEDGRVWSFKRNRWLKPSYNNKSGYLYINLCKNGKRYSKRIHRLVALAFIPNPDSKPCVDHINGARDDNRVNNLRWCTYKENNNFLLAKENKSKAQNRPEVREKIRKSMIGKKNSLGKKNAAKPIIINDVEYESATEASKQLDIPRHIICKRLKSKNFPNYKYRT